MLSSTLLTRALLLCALCNKALLQKRYPSNPPLWDPLPTFTAPFIPVAHCTSHSPAQPRLPFCAASEPLTQRALHPKPQHPSKPAPLPHPAQHHTTQQPMQCAGGPRLTETLRELPLPRQLATSSARRPWLGATVPTAAQAASTCPHTPQHTTPLVCLRACSRHTDAHST